MRLLQDPHEPDVLFENILQEGTVGRHTMRVCTFVTAQLPSKMLLTCFSEAKDLQQQPADTPECRGRQRLEQ